MNFEYEYFPKDIILLTLGTLSSGPFGNNGNSTSILSDIFYIFCIFLNILFYCILLYLYIFVLLLVFFFFFALNYKF